MFVYAVVCFFTVLSITDAFGFTPFKKAAKNLLASTITDISDKTWQENVDIILDIDTPCDKRRDVAAEIIKKTSDITTDVIQAIQDKDVKKIAPPNLGYGKAVEGLQAVRRQLFSDIIPGLLFNEGPKLLQEAPKTITSLLSDGPEVASTLFSRGQDLVTKIRDISQDPSMLQSTVDDLRREAKNIVKSTPEGLDTPQYAVLKTTSNYEIRKYSSYSVCTTELPMDAEIAMSPVASAKGFNILADYLFGNNNKDTKSESMAMTTPVIVGNGKMSFILPSGKVASNAPTPATSDISIKDIPSEIVAVREFPGIATDGEVSRQRAVLEDALLADGLQFDNISFQTLQYNPPYTLPWLRRNEVSIRVLDSPFESVAVTESVVVDVSTYDEGSAFVSAPEAGD